MLLAGSTYDLRDEQRTVDATPIKRTCPCSLSELEDSRRIGSLYAAPVHMHANDPVGILHTSSSRRGCNYQV